MGIGVLGPFEVVAGGAPLAVGGPQPRAVLALLALRANEVVGAATLVDGLWGDRPPDTAVRVVRTYVSRLRRVLDGVPELGAHVVSASPGYRLAIDPEQVDALLFERLVTSARAHAEGSRLDAAAAELRRAVDVWRGDVLADMPGLRPARAAVSHLEQLRLAALDERVEADLRWVGTPGSSPSWWSSRGPTRTGSGCGASSWLPL